MKKRLKISRKGIIFLSVTVLLCGVFMFKAVQAIRPKTIVCLGDSITSGFKLNNPQTYSFPAQLEKMLGGKFITVNAGVPGATLLKKGDIPIWEQQAFSAVMNTRASYAVLMLGTNDTKDNNWQYRNDFITDYKDLVERLHNIEGHPEVIVCSLPPCLDERFSGISDQRAAILSEEVQALADELHLHFVDITSPMASHPEYFIDGLHPNEQGDAVIAHHIKNKLAELMHNK